jgi:uroporphyrinogen III methyltransferase/synthase
MTVMDNPIPLKGLTFLNTRDARSAPALSDMLQEQGGRVVECPTIEIAPPSSWREFDARTAQITQDDWIVFTSQNAVRATLERLWELNQPPGILNRGRVATIGQGTSAALEREKIAVAYVPPLAQQEALLEGLLARLKRGDKVWMPRAQDARELLVDGLRAAGYPVSITPVYRTTTPRAGLTPAREDLLAGRVDWILFTSTSTVAHFFELLDADLRARLDSRWPQVACIGAVTADTAREHGLAVSVVPSRQDLPGLVAALVEHVARGGGE